VSGARCGANGCQPSLSSPCRRCAWHLARRDSRDRTVSHTARYNVHASTRLAESLACGRRPVASSLVEPRITRSDHNEDLSQIASVQRSPCQPFARPRPLPRLKMSPPLRIAMQSPGTAARLRGWRSGRRPVRNEDERRSRDPHSSAGVNLSRLPRPRTARGQPLSKFRQRSCGECALRRNPPRLSQPVPEYAWQAQRLGPGGRSGQRGN